jgi:hypothetical protein
VSPPACVGKDEGSQGDDWFTTNDRLIHDWQAYAGRYHPTTVQAHLVSVRDFEMFLVGMPFDKVKPKDVAANSQNDVHDFRVTFPAREIRTADD